MLKLSLVGKYISRFSKYTCEENGFDLPHWIQIQCMQAFNNLEDLKDDNWKWKKKKHQERSEFIWKQTLTKHLFFSREIIKTNVSEQMPVKKLTQNQKM